MFVSRSKILILRKQKKIPMPLFFFENQLNTFMSQANIKSIYNKL